MVIRKLKTSELSDLDTKQRIMEAAQNLFALKGYDGASIREIAELANVNVAALNYHFKSKDNLRQEMLDSIISQFKGKMTSIEGAESAAQYAVKVFEGMTEDSSMCVNQFKIIIDSDSNVCDQDPYPLGYEVFSVFLAKELKKTVPEAERLWLTNVVFGYIVHISIISSTAFGQKKIDRFLPQKKASIPVYISQLVESLIRDLNQRY